MADVVKEDETEYPRGDIEEGVSERTSNAAGRPASLLHVRSKYGACTHK